MPIEHAAGTDGCKREQQLRNPPRRAIRQGAGDQVSQNRAPTANDPIAESRRSVARDTRRSRTPSVQHRRTAERPAMPRADRKRAAVVVPAVYHSPIVFRRSQLMQRTLCNERSGARRHADAAITNAQGNLHPQDRPHPLAWPSRQLGEGYGDKESYRDSNVKRAK